MNKERILTLANFIEFLPEEAELDMASPSIPDPVCGTAGCIAGYASILWPDECQTVVDGKRVWLSDMVADALGISQPIAEELFFNCPTNDIDIYGNKKETIGYGNITKDVAVGALRRLVNERRVLFTKKDRKS